MFAAGRPTAAPRHSGTTPNAWPSAGAQVVRGAAPRCGPAVGPSAAQVRFRRSSLNLDRAFCSADAAPT